MPTALVNMATVCVCVYVVLTGSSSCPGPGRSVQQPPCSQRVRYDLQPEGHQTLLLTFNPSVLNLLSKKFNLKKTKQNRKL